MAKRSDDEHGWLAAARGGSREALGNALEACRRYLLRVANHRLAPDLRAKGGASDVVQQTFLEAQRDFAQFHGDNEAQLLAWLRQLLLNNMANFERGFRGVGKRLVSLEVPLNAGGSSTAGGCLAAASPSPSQVAIENEETKALAAAIERLPTDYRRVIELRHREQYTFEQIALTMGRSTSGARTLWLKAVERLNQELS